MYGPFLFGGKVLLYTGIGSDSLNEDYPNVVHLSEYIRTSGVPLWSFHMGIGQSSYPFVPLLLFNPVAWLPKGAIAEALPWQQLLKVVLAGLLFFRFLELRGLAFRAAAAGGVLLAFSAYMCIGACWSVAGNELVGFAFLLCAVERTLTLGRWSCVPLAVALLGLLTVFHLYLAALLLCLYVPARIVALHGWHWRPLWRIGAPLALAAFLGCGLAAVIAFDALAVIFNSPRAPGTVSTMATLADKPVFGLASEHHYLTCLMRWFSNDMMASGTKFRGWYNYFEAPTNYCGLLSLVLLPHAFVGATRRQRILYSLFLLFAVLPVVFPWFRYAFWAFQGDYYRAFSLFRVFGVIGLAMIALSRIVTERRVNLWIAGGTAVAAILLLWVPSVNQNKLVLPSLRMAATGYLAGYAILMALGHFLRRESLFVWLMLGLAATELAYFDRITVAERDVLTKSQLVARIGYNDHTIEAVRDVKQHDPTFYRVTKLYSSSPAIHDSLNDDMVFGYFGTRSYSSFNDMDYIRFLSALDVISRTPTEAETRWTQGLWERPLLSTFAAEKYVFTHDPRPFQFDSTYEFVARHDEVHVYRNKMFLPFGLVSQRYVPENEFLTWPTGAKEHALFYAVVLSEDDIATHPGLAQTNLLRLDLDGLANMVKREPLSRRLSQLRAAGMQMRSFDHNLIEGTVEIAQDAVIVFQTAFARGWRAYVNGVRVATIKADVGLIGVPLQAGKNELRLRYVPQHLPLGAFVTVCAAILFGYALHRWPRLQGRPDPDPASAVEHRPNAAVAA